MDHQPFEEWLLGEARLSPDQAAACRAHLAQCSQCRDVQRAWEEVQAELGTASMAAPDPGFTLRWQDRLEADRLARGRKKAALAFAGSLLALLLLGAARSPEPVSLAEAATNLFGSLVKLGNLFYLVRNLVSAFVGAMSGGSAGAWWAAAAAAACGLVGAWFISLYYFTLRWVRKGVVT